ncbi:MAG: tetratricopeptide repeat protein [Phycisphaerales bacterium]|nr:tetratricopeptide repeat protein [Phycisphaerales bacterium]
MKRALVGSAIFALSIGALIGCAPSIEEMRVTGIEQFRGRQFVESTATMRHILEQQPNDAEANYYMGLNYRAMAERKFRDGNVAAAARELDISTMYFTQAIKSWPNYMSAIAAKNEALEARGKFEAALTLAERATSNNRGIAEHFVYLGDEYRQRGDHDNALRRYKTALGIDPQNAKAFAGMGQLYLLVGERALAMDAFRRAYEIDPRETGAADALNQLMSESGTYTASHEASLRP